MSFKRSYTAHPVMIIYYLKPFLFFLLLPLLKAIVDAMLKQSVDGFVVNEIALFLSIIVYSVIKWKNVKITLTQDKIKIRTGLVLNRAAEIPIEKISTIQTVQYFSDCLLGSVTVRINTESGRKGRSDFEIKLYKRDAESISEVLFNAEKSQMIKFSPVKVALTAAASSSAFTGLVFIVPVIKQTGNLLGTAIEEILFNRINEMSSAINKVIPPIINTITIVFLILYGIAFLVSFFKYINFRVKIIGNIMQTTSGLITRFNIAFKIKSINSAIIEQTPLMRFFGRYLVRVSIGGYGDNKGYKAVVIPSVKKKEATDLFSEFFPNVQASSGFITPKGFSRKRFYFMPTVFLLISLVAYYFLIRLFPVFSDVINFILLIAIIILMYYYNLAEYNVKHSAISVSNILYAKYTRWSAIREMFCEADRVGLVHITKWPADRQYKTCNVRITEQSESAESITVKHIDYSDIKRELSSFYGFE